MKMKKALVLTLVSVFALCLAAISLSSCGGAEKREYTLPKTVKITNETVAAADGEPITVTITADGGTFAIKRSDEDYWDEDTYDADGNHTMHRYYEFNELRLEFLYRYDKNGRKTSWERYDLYEGRSSGKYSYNAAGKVTEEVSYDENGKIRWTNKCEYDEKGHKSRETMYDAKGEMDMEWTFECDAEGRVLKIWFEEAYGTKYCDSARTYDASGNLLTETSYSVEGSLFKQDSYTYDESGREVEKVTTYGDDGEVFKRTVTVYEADGRSTRTIYGKERVIIYRCDQVGRVVEKGEYDQGELGWWYVYTYDENGLLAKREGRLGAGEDVLQRTEVTEYQTVSLTEAQYEAFAALFTEYRGSYFCE